MRFAFIASTAMPVRSSGLGEALDVLRSGFHAWLTRPVSAHAITDEQLLKQIARSLQRELPHLRRAPALGTTCWPKG